MSGKNTIWIIILLIYLLGESVSAYEARCIEGFESGAVLDKQQDIEDNEQIVNTDSTDKFYYETYFEKNDEAGEFFPKEMTDYLAEALENEDIIEKLNEILAEYTCLTPKMLNMEMADKDNLNVLSGYQNMMGSDTDNWYKMSAVPQQESIMVVHEKDDESYIMYVFNGNKKTYERALCVKGQSQSEPYFIEWNGKKYIAILHWKNGQIDGVTIYDYGHEALVGIVACLGLDENKNRTETYFYCVISGTGTQPDGTSMWPYFESENGIDELHLTADYMFPNMSFLELDYNPDNAIPEELENVLEQVVLNKNLQNFAEENEAEYIKLSGSNAQEYMQKDSAGVLWNYCCTDGQKIEGEEYFLFINTEDIIVRQPMDDEHYVYYKFQRADKEDTITYKKALRALGYNADFYFIEWDGKAYLITTRGKEKNGIAIYCMGAENIYGWLLYLEEENGVVKKRYYTYVSNGTNYMGSYWPEY